MRSICLSTLGSLVVSVAAQPCFTMSLACLGGHGAAAGARLILGTSGVVTARGLMIGEALLEAVGAAVDPDLGIGGLGFVTTSGPHLAFGGVATRGVRTRGDLTWERLGGAVWPWVLRLRAEVLLEVDTARLAAGVWAGLWYAAMPVVRPRVPPPPIGPPMGPWCW